MTMEQPTQRNNGDADNAVNNGADAAGMYEVNEADGRKYKVLGESGLVEDEDGEIFDINDIFPPSDNLHEIPSERLKGFGVSSVLDDKANPAYWYYIYDERYCGESREEYCEKMAAQYRQRAAAVKEEAGRKTTSEAAKDYADREQRAIERDGLHPVLKLFVNSSSITIVDRQGRVVISNKVYRSFGKFSNGLAWAQRRDTKKFGFVNRHGQEIISCMWRSVGNFSEYLAAVVDINRRCGYVDVTGRLAIPCQWVEAWPFHEGFARVQNENKRIGMIDTSGKLVVKCHWTGMSDFYEGLAVVKDGEGKCGYIDKTGAEVIPCRWKNAWAFCEGMAVVQDFNKRLGYINKQGNLVVPCRWRRANFFSHGLAKVSDTKAGLFGWKWVFIDKQGQVVRQA